MPRRGGLHLSAQRCAADPGSISQGNKWQYRSRLCGAARRALHRVRDTSGFCSRRRAVICPSGRLLTGVSSLISDFPKNISVPIHPKSDLELFASHPTEGRIAIVTDAGRDAVDAAASGAQCDGRAGWRKARERSNGELTNDVAAYGEVVWS